MTKVKEIMKPAKKGAGINTGLTVNADESIDNAALLMRDNHLEQIAVLNDSGRLVGVVTKDALIEASDELNEDFFID